MQIRYRLIDVFAERPFTGNPVAVFTDARGLDTTTMQRIARELNLSRTSFIVPGTDGGNSIVRVFSSLSERPSPQCSTIGAAFALELDEKEPTVQQGRQRVVFESETGPISVSTFARVLTVRHQVPRLGAFYQDVDAVMATLGLSNDDRMSGAPIQAIHGEMPFLIVPLRGQAALKRITFRQDIWERTIRRFEAPNILAFTMETERGSSVARLRALMPDSGVYEEPATEEACGPLAAYLVRYGFAATESPQLLIFEQGAEAGRPSVMHVAIERSENDLTSVRVGGQCVHVGDGFLTPVSVPGMHRQGY
jgi:trans-2,3-dihydro-3-hydroxyanthranilate isomerase